MCGHKNWPQCTTPLRCNVCTCAIGQASRFDIPGTDIWAMGVETRTLALQAPPSSLITGTPGYIPTVARLAQVGVYLLPCRAFLEYQKCNDHFINHICGYGKRTWIQQLSLGKRRQNLPLIMARRAVAIVLLLLSLHSFAAAQGEPHGNGRPALHVTNSYAR